MHLGGRAFFFSARVGGPCFIELAMGQTCSRRFAITARRRRDWLQLAWARLVRHIFRARQFQSIFHGLGMLLQLRYSRVFLTRLSKVVALHP